MSAAKQHSACRAALGPPPNAKADLPTILCDDLQSMVRQVSREFGNSEDAEDAVQEAFLRFLEYQPNYEHSGRPSSYVVAIARNIIRSNKRRDVRQKSLAPAACLGAEWLCLNSTDERELLKTAIRRLPLNQRVAIRLRFFDGFETKRIAGFLGLSPASARATISRGLQNLRKVVPEGLYPTNSCR